MNHLTTFHFSDPAEALAGGFGRSFKTNDDIGNLLRRTIVDDQVDILGVTKLFPI